MTHSSELLDGRSPAARRHGLEGMRDVLRGSLSRSLHAIPAIDRLAAAWTVTCGRALAGRGSVTGYSQGVVQIEVVDSVWVTQMSSMRGALAAQLAESSGLAVETIEFTIQRRSAV